MLRRVVPVLAVFAMLLAAPPAQAVKTPKKAKPAPAVDPAAKIEPVDAAELVRQANDLFHLNKDYNGAMAKFNQAVEAAPNDGGIRLDRALFFEIVASLVIPSEKEQFQQLARDDYKRVSDDTPDSIRGGIARDGLTRLSGTTLIEEASVSCPPEANAAHDRAESLFGAHRFAEAAAEYEKATTACPKAAPYWVHYADAYFLLEQYDKAKELFGKALEADPWSRAGHRFLADTEAKLSNQEGVIRQLELAVVSDPVYEAGWSALRTYATGFGRKWTRVYGEKPVVARKPDEDGQKNISLALPAEKFLKSGDGDGTAWMIYGLLKASLLSGEIADTDASGNTVKRKVDPSSMSAFEIEREAVKHALEMAPETGGQPSEKPGPFWSMMARADAAGFLDEAIFLHMLDAPLAAEYPAFRQKNAERLVTYLDTVVVP